MVRRQLLENGLDSQRIDALCAPIGLAIGAKTAQEIALSILAQIVEIKSHRQLTEGFTPEIRAAWAQCRQEQTDAVLATIVSRHGSMPREVGTKMLILPDGSTAGSVGGGIMGVVPGVMGVAAFAPPLDGAGNSVKAQKALAFIAGHLNLNVFGTTRCVMAGKEPVKA